MLTNESPSVRRSLLVKAALGAAGLALMACGSPPTNQSATTEPVLHTFVGRFAQQPGLKIALLVGRDSSVAYLCDNRSGAELLRGGVRRHSSGGTVELKAGDGTTLDATFGAREATGAVSLPGRPAARFTAQLASGAAGLYEASAAVGNGSLRGRWIVGNDGQVAGTLKLNGQPVGNPPLQPTVKVGAAILAPAAVRTLPPAASGPAVGRAILDRSPAINGAYSLPCGEFHVRGSGFDSGAPVDVSVVEQYPANPHDYGPLAEQSITVQSDGSIASDLAFSVTFQPGVVGSGYDVVARAIEYPVDPSMERVVSLYARAC